MLRSADLTPDIVAKIKGMLKRGDKQFEIAMWFDTPVAHVSNIATRKRDREVLAAPLEFLPPAGPYQIVSVEAHERLASAAAVPLRTMEEINDRLARLQSTVDQLLKREHAHGNQDDSRAHDLRVPHTAYQR